MKRAIFSLAALAALSLAACGGGDAAPGDQTPGSVPEQAQPAGSNAADPASNGGAVAPEGARPGAPVVVEDEEAPAPTGGYGGGEKMKYADCMTQSRQAGGDIGKQIEAACRRLPDAPK